MIRFYFEKGSVCKVLVSADGSLAGGSHKATKYAAIKNVIALTRQLLIKSELAAVKQLATDLRNDVSVIAATR